MGREHTLCHAILAETADSGARPVADSRGRGYGLRLRGGAPRNGDALNLEEQLVEVGGTLWGQNRAKQQENNGKLIDNMISGLPLTCSLSIDCVVIQGQFKGAWLERRTLEEEEEKWEGEKEVDEATK
ncbi:hypothetical protein EYF80_032842 [Liparis tanakae]|uniref:Uncharacterized protein n=1 Tax=Liparis tanakae TaxID=230148 RepID=A0A4Z2GWJ4_9TELE|nr:hypothetical protein EYF80_032842 [Liparis tanakae]